MRKQTAVAIHSIIALSLRFFVVCHVLLLAAFVFFAAQGNIAAAVLALSPHLLLALVAGVGRAVLHIARQDEGCQAMEDSVTGFVAHAVRLNSALHANAVRSNGTFH